MTWTRWRQSGSLFVVLACAATLHAGTTSDSGKQDPFGQVPEVRLAAADADNGKEATEPKEGEAKEAAGHAEDEMEDLQSFNTYTALEDGQPGQPGEIQINYFSGWQTSSGESDPWLMEPQIEITLGKDSSSFLRNTKIGIATPLELGNGGVDGNGDIELSWIQRWIAEQPGCWWPTFSTVNELRIPSGYHSEKVDWTLTGVLAKNLGPGTAYMNAFIKSANGSNNLEEAGSWWDQVQGNESDDLRNFQWGFRWGYKWRITDCFAIIPAYILQSSQMRGEHDQHIGEVSAEWRVNEHLTIGPGITFTLDGNDDHPNFGAGVAIHYEF